MFAAETQQSSFSDCHLFLTFPNNHYRRILLNKVPADTETHQTNDQTKIKDLFGVVQAWVDHRGS